MHAFSSSEVNRMNRICTKHAEKWIAQTLEPLVNADDSTNKNQPPFFDPSKEMSRVTFGSIMESAFEYDATEEDFNIFFSPC